ncbi:DUF3095 domain-containing protein [Cerasicoccus maritimus]|uniref:DUF3095 domain-containing protein n=1 Tax=Cerasicoccus maritimus TaxID=490089 RepID=UPI0028529488|nr:DUF3095 domain-containing protein [Cerasicoccus maritimus]
MSARQISKNHLDELVPPAEGISFVQQLPLIKSLREAVDPGVYRRLPKDWLIALTDVQGSTENLRLGRYKEVNGVGVAAIAGVRNQHKPEEIPFVFGGDGATFCLPPERRADVEAVLRASSRMAREDFGLKLRIGIVPHADIIAQGREVRVARLQLTEWVTQTMFMGGGLEKADELVKDPRADNPYRLTEEGPQNADFSGLECRWDNVPSRHGETVAYIFRAMGTEHQRASIFRQLIAMVEDAYGDSEQSNPLHLGGLKLTNKPALLRLEQRVRTFAQNAVRRWSYGKYLRLQIIVGRIIMKYGLKFAGVDWSHYQRDLIANADFRKIDDCLRFVLSGTTGQREELIARVKEAFKPEQLVFGSHVADSAIMTCVIDDYQHEHLHFVDGADGGYALAAKQMKAKIKALETA